MRGRQNSTSVMVWGRDRANESAACVLFATSDRGGKGSSLVEHIDKNSGVSRFALTPCPPIESMQHRLVFVLGMAGLRAFPHV
jgi:hypothetical protein